MLEKNVWWEWMVCGDVFFVLLVEFVIVVVVVVLFELQVLLVLGNVIFDLELVQVELQCYSQCLVKVIMVCGCIVEGCFIGFDSEGCLVICWEMFGVGEVSYLLCLVEIVCFELFECQLLYDGVWFFCISV